MEVTTVIAVDREHLAELQAVWPTWKRWHPEIMENRLVIIRDASTEVDLGPSHPNWRTVVVDGGGVQRDKMLRGLLLQAPYCIDTTHWLKIDTDTICTGPGPPLTDFLDTDSIAASPWGYSKPVDAIARLDAWYADATGEPPMHNVQFRPNGHRRERERAYCPRIIGWLSVLNTEFSRRVADFLVKHPPPFISHDTLLWYLSERWGVPAKRVQFKKHGWDHKLGLRSIREKVSEVMASARPGSSVELTLTAPAGSPPIADEPDLPFAPKPIGVPESIEWTGKVATVSTPLTPLRETPPHSRVLADVLREHFGGTDTPLVGAEIGVYRGETSRHLLGTFPNLTLFMVDPWKEVTGAEHDKLQGDRVSGAGQASFDEWRREAYAATDVFRDRRVVFEMRSCDVASQFGVAGILNHGKWGFAFIDGPHDYASVRHDVGVFWTFVANGGILCGHDFGHRRFTGVTKAVDEFAADKGLQVRVHAKKVWSIVKP